MIPSLKLALHAPFIGQDLHSKSRRPKITSAIELKFMTTLAEYGWFDLDSAGKESISNGIAKLNSTRSHRDGLAKAAMPTYIVGSMHGIFVTAQLPVFPVGSLYFLDFAFVYAETRLALELDGHEFHERTKEQASMDKKRDRELTRDGWKILRFTGSEIWNRPIEAMWECVELMRETVF